MQKKVYQQGNILIMRLRTQKVIFIGLGAGLIVASVVSLLVVNLL